MLITLSMLFYFLQYTVIEFSNKVLTMSFVPLEVWNKGLKLISFALCTIAMKTTLKKKCPGQWNVGCQIKFIIYMLINLHLKGIIELVWWNAILFNHCKISRFAIWQSLCYCILVNGFIVWFCTCTL